MRKRLRLLVRAAVAPAAFASTLLMGASPARATTLFAEDFEGIQAGDVSGSNQGYQDLVAHGWYVSAGCNGYCSMAIVNAPTGRTGKVLRYEYREPNMEAIPVPAQDSHNSNLIYTFANGLTELYAREYVRFDVDKTGDPSATQSQFFLAGYKHHYIKVNQGPTYIAGEHFDGDREAGFAQQELADCNAVYKGGPGCPNLKPTMEHVPFNDGEWHCIEYHVKLNSSDTASDGMLEFWVDNKQTLGSYNRKMWDSHFGLEGSKIRSIEVYRQHSSVMYRYEDDLVWSTTRLGDCGGSGAASADAGVVDDAGAPGGASSDAGAKGQGGSVARDVPSSEDSGGCSVRPRGKAHVASLGGFFAAALIACRLWRVTRRKRAS